MHIAINASFLRKPHTGIGQVTLHLLHTLIDNEREVPSTHTYTLFVEDLDSAKKELGSLPDHFTLKTCNPPYKRDDLIRKTWWELFSLPAAIKKEKCKAALSFYQCPSVLHGIKHTMIVHDIIPEIMPKDYLSNMRKRIYWLLTKRGIRKSDIVLTASDRTKRDIKEHLKIQHHDMHTIKLGIDPLFHKEPTIDELKRMRNKYHITNPYIYVGGGLEVRKNVERVMRAYAELAHSVPDFPDLVISGKIQEHLIPAVTDVRGLVRELQIEDKTHLLGFVPSEDLPALYKASSLFVFASSYEGFGLPVLEAMTVGAPVLTGRNSSLPEVGGNEVAYCDAHSQSDIAQKMLSLLYLSSEERTTMISGAQLRAKEFRWDIALHDVRNAMEI